MLLPEYRGLFVFIGDDGQQDLNAAVHLLRRTDEDGQNLLAFAAIKRVWRGDGDGKSYVQPNPLSVVEQKNREVSTFPQV